MSEDRFEIGDEDTMTRQELRMVLVELSLVDAQGNLTAPIQRSLMDFLEQPDSEFPET